MYEKYVSYTVYAMHEVYAMFVMCEMYSMFVMYEMYEIYVTEYMIVYITRVLYDYTRLVLGLVSISLSVWITWKLSVPEWKKVILNEKVLKENHV